MLGVLSLPDTILSAMHAPGEGGKRELQSENADKTSVFPYQQPAS
jgi:hypothetical protein